MSLKLALILSVSLIPSGSPSSAQEDAKSVDGDSRAWPGAGHPVSKAVLAGAKVLCADHEGSWSGGKTGVFPGGKAGALSEGKDGAFSGGKDGTLSGGKGGAIFGGKDMAFSEAPAASGNCDACCSDSDEPEECLSFCRAARQDGKRLKASGKLANASPDPFEILTPVEEVEAPGRESFEPCPQYKTTIYRPPESEQCGGSGVGISAKENAK